MTNEYKLDYIQGLIDMFNFIRGDECFKNLNIVRFNSNYDELDDAVIESIDNWFSVTDDNISHDDVVDLVTHSNPAHEFIYHNIDSRIADCIGILFDEDRIIAIVQDETTGTVRIFGY